MRLTIYLGVTARADNPRESVEVGLALGPELTFTNIETAASWLETLAGEGPRDPIRAYANRVRREGPRVARRLARLMVARLMS